MTLINLPLLFPFAAQKEEIRRKEKKSQTELNGDVDGQAKDSVSEKKSGIYKMAH